MPGLEPGRAPVIVAGARRAREVIAAYGLDELEVERARPPRRRRARGRRLPEPEEGAAPPGAYTCCSTVPSSSSSGAARPRRGGAGPRCARARRRAGRRVDDRHALEVLLLEEAERLVERRVRVDREVRLLGDLAEPVVARVAPGGDDLAHERLARDDADRRPPSATKTARTSGGASASPASCALRVRRAGAGSATIASRTRPSLTGRSRAPRARPRPRGCRRRAPPCAATARAPRRSPRRGRTRR